MKKTLSAFIILILVFALAACGSKTAAPEPVGSMAEDLGPGIKFKNDLDITADKVYLATSESDMWGDPVNAAPVKPGEEIEISAEYLSDPNGVYSFCITDQNVQNYEVDNITLLAGDTISISGEGEEPVCTVTTEAGNSATYSCNVFSE